MKKTPAARSGRQRLRALAPLLFVLVAVVSWLGREGQGQRPPATDRDGWVSLDGRLERLRIYDRYIRTSEAIANFYSGV